MGVFKYLGNTGKGEINPENKTEPDVRHIRFSYCTETCEDCNSECRRPSSHGHNLGKPEHKCPRHRSD